MTEVKTPLVGEWKFIKAEQHNGTDWEPTNHTDGMSWEFHPEYISTSKIIGIIVETAPLVDEVRLNYTFSESDNLLRIEVYTDPETRIKDETDIYEVTFAEAPTDQKPTITVELINQIGCPPPYLRHTLQQC
ncbi:MAG: hypothetical protein SNI32_06245 [Rikenellaceae bacterium]